jgi:hypothetical protein
MRWDEQLENFINGIEAPNGLHALQSLSENPSVKNCWEIM